MTSTEVEFRPSYTKSAFALGLRPTSSSSTTTTTTTSSQPTPTPQTTTTTRHHASTQQKSSSNTTSANASSNEQTEVEFPSAPLVYEREWLLKFQTTCVNAPAQLKPVAAVVCAPAEQTKLRNAAFAAQLEREKATAAQKKELKIRPGKRDESNASGSSGNNALQKGEDRWLPSAQDKKKPGRTLEQSFLSNLNKLTLENFALLSKQLIDLVRSINSLSQLTAITQLVFDKALSEPKFAAMYAQLCVILSAHAPWFESAQDGAKLSFRSELLNRAQDEFEGEHIDDLSAHIKAQLAPSADAAEIDEAALKYRARKLGNIKFIGELYKLALLKAGTLRAGVLEPLLGTARAAAGAVSDAVREAAVEKLAKLLGTIGDVLEQRDIAVAETYFLAVRDLSTQKDVASRVHFLLLNLLELRANKWVARRKQDAPQRIGELHADAHAADADFAYLLPADLVSGMAKTAASLPAPSGKPSRTQVSNELVLWLPGGAAASDSSDAATTGTPEPKKKLGKSVAFSEPVASPEDRIAALVEELFSSHDTDEAVTAFGELTPKDASLNVEHVIRAAIELAAPTITVLAKFLSALVQKRAVERDIVSGAVQEVVSQIADTALDFPAAPKFVGLLLRELHMSKLIDGPKLLTASGLDNKWQQKLRDAK